MSTIEDLLLRAVDESPARPAVRWHEVQWTFGDLDRAVDQCADSLRSAGITTGDRVALLLPNVPAAAVLLFATWRVGGVAVPLSDRLRAEDLHSALAATDPTIVVAVERAGMPSTGLIEGRATLAASPLGDVVRADAGARVERDPSDGALVLTTSGSTGSPKAVVVPHHREVESADTLAGLLRLEPRDVTALAVSVTHAFGLSCLLTAIAAASEIVLVDSTTGAGPLYDAVERASIVHGSPTLFASLASATRPLPSSMRTGFVAGASAPPSLLERLDEVGLVLLNLYGMTEIGAAASTSLDDGSAVRWTTSGRALAGHELRVVEGEVHVRGSHVSPGYFRQPDRTAQSYVDGWLHTGDLGTIDDEGNLRISGRLDEQVSVAGFNVSPAEVETCLLGHPEVAGAVVVAVTDERLGHRLVAFVVGAEGSSLAARDLLAHVRARLAGYKVPYRVEFMEALPRLATGKPDRRALWRLAEGAEQ